MDVLSTNFVDNVTPLNAATLNPIVAKINELVVAYNALEPAPTVATPVINVNNGVVSISCSTIGASIYYTTNGSTPSSSSTLYSAAFTPPSGTSQIKAIAILSGASSQVATKSYSPAPSPSVNAPVISADWTDGQSLITLTADSGVTIKYTTDGTIPSSSNGNTYSEPFATLSGIAQIKAIAILNGVSSGVASTPDIMTSEGVSYNNTNSKCKADEAETIYYVKMQVGRRYNIVMDSSMDFVRTAVTEAAPTVGVVYNGRQAGGKGTHKFSAYINSDGSGLVEKITSSTSQSAIQLASTSDIYVGVGIPTAGLNSVIFTESNI